jgi:ankyrin repeat protein
MTVRNTVYLLCLAALVCAADSVNTSFATAGDYLRAIRANDLAALKDYCKAGVAGVHDRLNYTPLHYAAVYGSVDSVRIVLDAGGDPNARNRSQATPLIYAAYDFEKTRLMVEKGGDVNAKTEDGTTSLWVAEGVPGNEKTVRYLIDKGADLKQTRTPGSDFLLRAAGPQDASTVRFLLDRGLDPHRANGSGETALLESMACDGGAKARMLIAAGADVNAFNTYAGSVKNGPIESTGETPLMLSAACGETDVMEALIKAGAKIDAVDHRHMTALMRAVAVDHANPRAARLLISAGADLNVGDRNSETALDWARKFRNPAVVAARGGRGA